MYSITPTDISNFESYLVQSDKNINTIKKYVRDIMKFRTFLLEQQREFTQAATDEYLLSLIDAGYEIRSVNSVIAGSKSFCKFLGRRDIINALFQCRIRRYLDTFGCLVASLYVE